MLEAILSALAEITSGTHLLYLFGGVFMGLVVGIFPGLGGIVGLSLLLPFLYGMDPTSALAMLIGLVAIIPTSDTFTSVLMGIPGSSASQATVLDGFPLAKKGEAARALGAAFSASLYGGIIGAIVLTFFIVVARPIILLQDDDAGERRPAPHPGRGQLGARHPTGVFGRREHAVDDDRLGDVLDLVLAKVFVTQIELLPDLVEHRPREGDTARLGKHFETRRNIHAITQKVIALDYHVTEVDTDAKVHAPILR